MSWIYAFPCKSVINGVESFAVAQLTLSHTINFKRLLTPLVARLAACYFSLIRRLECWEEKQEGSLCQSWDKILLKNLPELDVIPVHREITSQRGKWTQQGRRNEGQINIYGSVHVVVRSGLKTLKAHPAAVELLLLAKQTHTHAHSFKLAHLYNFNQFSRCFILCQEVEMCPRDGSRECSQAVLISGKHLHMYS